LARLKREHPLERYNVEELRTEFFKLTGETAQGILRVLGMDDTVEAMQRLMHFTILNANVQGAPKGQPLIQQDYVQASTFGNIFLCVFILELYIVLSVIINMIIRILVWQRYLF